MFHISYLLFKKKKAQVPVAIQGLVPGLAIPNLANIMPGLVPTPIGTTAQTALPNLATTMGSLLNPVSLPIPTPTPVPQPARCTFLSLICFFLFQNLIHLTTLIALTIECTLDPFTLTFPKNTFQ